MKRVRLVIADLLPLERVALDEMFKGAPLIADGGKRFAEREMEIDLLADFERATLADEPQHRGQVAVVGRETVGARQVPIITRLAGCERDRRLEGAARVFHPSERHLRGAKAGVDFRIARVDRQRLLKMSER